ncbi:MAG: hypothetical protein IPK15_04155 [Verrucomicrobia bacterium]|nr:hypothetical protein [Verrucomicrobiota bacterium]
MKPRFWLVTFGWILLGFSPAAMELAFRWSPAIFIPVNLSCSAVGAWILFQPEKKSIALCACAFFFMNMTIALILGCAAVLRGLGGSG